MKTKTRADLLMILLSILLFLGFIMALSSCSPTKRLARLLRNHPELKAADTLTIKDTVIIPAFSFDTVFKYEKRVGDTVTIYRDKIKIRYYASGDTVYISASAPADTVIKEKKIIVSKIIDPAPEKKINFWKMAGIIFLIFNLGALTGYVFSLARRFIRNFRSLR